MGFTPAFQKVWAKLEKMSEDGASEVEIKNAFKAGMLEIGPWERLCNLYKIRPKRAIPGETSRLQFFTPNRMQTTFWGNHSNRDLILKMRQGGVTTFSCLIALDKCLWNEGQHCAIMAHVRDNVKKFFRITKTAFTAFQKDWGHLYPVTQKIDNENELKIAETGSELLVATETKGLTLDFLHISESAFVDDERISESIESVPMSGWVIMESTPNVASGMFYEIWDRASKGETSAYKTHFFEWWYHYPEPEDISLLKVDSSFKPSDDELALMKAQDLTPEHIIWRRLKLSESGGDLAEFRRKYPEDAMTAFLSGSRSVFSPDVLVSLWRNERKPSFYGDLQAA